MTFQVQQPEGPLRSFEFQGQTADDNRLTFGHYIYNAGEPIMIKRVDVPVRLEKPLAALLP